MNKSINEYRGFLKCSFFPICLATFFLVSCSSHYEPPTPPPSTPADIYVGGFVPDASTQPQAAVWKNGALMLYTHAPGFVFSLVTDLNYSGGHLYAVGAESDNIQVTATLWKDGVVSLLPKDYSNSNTFASTVLVAGNDVYVGGTETVNSESFGKIWKNGQTYFIFPVNQVTDVSRMAMIGTDLYVVGYENGPSNSYWKFTASMPFDPTEYPQTDLDAIEGLYIDGNDIYLAGNKGNSARYLKNGTIVDLPGNNAGATGVYVQNQDVYLVGTADSKPVVWKNGTLENIEGDASTASPWNLTISPDNDYYATGSYEANADFYWKNGSKVQLPGYVTCVTWGKP